MNLNNPELERNLILELSPGTCLGIPLALAMIFAPTYLAGDTLRAVGTVAPIVAGGAVLFSAAKVAHSLSREIRERTWDFQIMTGMSPWKMVWGKVLGSAILGWYTLFLTLPLLWVAYAKLESVSTATALTGAACLNALLLQLVALQSAALGSSGVSSSGKARQGASPIFVLLILASWPLLFQVALLSENMPIRWLHFTIDSRAFIPLTLTVLVAWATVGAHHALCCSLRVPKRAGAWLCFLLFVVGFIAAFNAPQYSRLTAWSAATVAMVVLAYAALLTEHVNLLQLRRMRSALKSHHYRLALAHTPLWLQALGVAIIPLIMLLVSGEMNARNSFGRFFPTFGEIGIVAFIMCLRDSILFTSLVLISSLTSSPARSVVFAFFFVYVGCPLLFSALGLTWLTAMFWPLTATDPFSLVLPPIVGLCLTAIICWAFVFRTWKHRLA